MLAFTKKTPQLLVVAGIAVGILTLNACGGGGSISQVARPNSTAAPQSGMASIAVNPAGMTASLPSVAGFTESITLPTNNAAAGTNLQLTITSAVPSGMPGLDPDMHVAIPFLYFALSSNKTVTLSGIPGFTLTIPVGFHTGSPPVKIGFYDPRTGWKHVGNMVMSGSTITFAPTSTPLTLMANVNYYAITYTCSSTTLPLAGPGKPMPIPKVGGFSGQFIVPTNNAPAGTTVTLTSFDVKPPNAPLPQAVNRRGASVAALSGGTVLFWVSSDYSSSFTFAAFPVTSFDLPEGTNTSGVTFHLETFNGSTLLDQEAASSVSGLTVNFPGTASPFAITTGHTYWWELISVPVTHIFVTNFNINTMTVYDEQGNQITTTGNFSNLNHAGHIAFDPNNHHLYVTNQGTPPNFTDPSVTVYDEDGNQITTSGSFPNLKVPGSITFDPNNHHLYVANNNDSVTVYDEQGNQITTSGSFPNVNTPDGITFDSKNHHLYVTNFGNNTLTVYDEQGNQIGTTGSFPGINSPQDLDFDPNNHRLYITNDGSPPNFTNPGVTVYDEDGNQITTTGSFPNLHNPISIAFDRINHHLYITNFGSPPNFTNPSVTVYDEDGNQISTSGSFPNLNNPAGITAGS